MYAKTKAQITAVAAQLISVFVFATDSTISVLLKSSFHHFLSDLVGNLKDRFSHVAAQLATLPASRDCKEETAVFHHVSKYVWEC